MKFYFHPFLTAALAATAVAATPTSFLDDPPVKLDKFAVITERARSLTFPLLSTARADLALTPGGAGLVDAESYLRGRASTVADTFALAAGVFAQPRFGSDEARLSIRGSGLQRTFHGRGLRVLQDGVPVNVADGSFDMQALEPLTARYIEVLRGGNALSAGAATLGGSINYVSRTGRDAVSGLARVEAGSFGYHRMLVADGSTQGNADAYAAFTATRQDSFRNHAVQENQRLFSNAGWRFSPDAETRLYLTAINTRSELPGNLLKSELADNPAVADPARLAQDQARNFKLVRVADKTTVRTGSTLWNFSAAWTYKDLDHPISPVVDQVTDDLLAGVDATQSGEFAGRANRLRGGLLFTRGTTNAANYVNVFGTRGALLSSAHTTATNLETFIEDQLELTGGITAVAGATAVHTRRVNEPLFAGTPAYRRDYDNFSPKIGLRWDGNGVQIYANISGSFEPPSFSEIGAITAPNRAQTATTWEIGTRGSHGPIRWDATFYHAKLRNEFLSLNDAAGISLGTINAPHTMHAGVELSGEADLLGQNWATSPAHRLVLRAAWTYGRFKFDHDPVYGDNTIAGLPPHLVRGELSWETRGGWYAGPSFEWVPQRAPVDHANTLFADAYAIFGFRVGHRSPKGFAWFGEVRNLADKHYAATTGVIADAKGRDSRQFLAGDGRGYFSGVEYRW